MEGERRVRCNSLAGGGTGVQDHKRGFRGQGELLPAPTSLQASATCSASFLVSFSIRNWITTKFSEILFPNAGSCWHSCCRIQGYWRNCHVTLLIYLRAANDEHLVFFRYDRRSCDEMWGWMELWGLPVWWRHATCGVVSDNFTIYYFPN
jgi:hypothetical protein